MARLAIQFPTQKESSLNPDGTPVFQSKKGRP
jgi:hypothetical protein